MGANKSYVQLVAYITPETRRKLRARAYREDRKITEIVREILERELADDPDPGMKTKKAPSP